MKKNKKLNTLALIISLFGSPFIVIATMFSFLAWHYKEGVAQFYTYLIVVIMFVLIIPIAYMLENIKDIKMIDLHLEKKEDREKVLFITTLSVLIGYFMLSFIGMPKPLLLIELVGIINLVIISIITFKMKLSIHLAVLTIAATLVVFFLGISYLWLYLLLLPLGWARVYRDKHSLSEMLMGIFISLVVTSVVIEIFLSMNNL